MRKIICNRCRKDIIESPFCMQKSPTLYLNVEIGNTCNAPIDLCDDCKSEFVAWLNNVVDNIK